MRLIVVRVQYKSFRVLLGVNADASRGPREQGKFAQTAHICRINLSLGKPPYGTKYDGTRLVTGCLVGMLRHRGKW